MNLARHLEPEILDGLAADDPDAVRSRRDLRRINGIMGSAGVIAGALAATPAQTGCDANTGQAPRRILELGAGDGSLMLVVARRLAAARPDTWTNVELTLMDRQAVVDAATVAAFGRLGWTVQIVNADVLDWCARPVTARFDVVVANLFIHHFSDACIATLFHAIAARADRCIACEPRRARLALTGSRLVGLIGANAVTRTDAVLSVRAGFAGAELACLWPPSTEPWRFDEGPARLFSHRFVATRMTPDHAVRKDRMSPNDAIP